MFSHRSNCSFSIDWKGSGIRYIIFTKNSVPTATNTAPNEHQPTQKHMARHFSPTSPPVVCERVQGNGSIVPPVPAVPPVTMAYWRTTSKVKLGLCEDVMLGNVWGSWCILLERQTCLSLLVYALEKKNMFMFFHESRRKSRVSF